MLGTLFDIFRRKPPVTSVAAQLAKDLGMRSDKVSRILDRTAADLRKLSESESDDVDARPIIDRAVNELSMLGFESRPFEEAAMERYLKELSERDYQILQLSKLGAKHSDIAAQLDTTVESVRKSLVKTYSELRMRMMGGPGGGGGGGGESAPQVRMGGTLAANDR